MTENPELSPGHDLYRQHVQEAWAGSHRSLRTLGELALHHGETLMRSNCAMLSTAISGLSALAPHFLAPEAKDAFRAYFKDFNQRSILYLDTLQRRGDSYIEREIQGFEPVLAFDYDVVIDGSTLERPVNYTLVRIRPPDDFPPQREDGRPWVIIDPRAGHGSGIGGFKSESEVGVALKDGHPVYFAIFYPNPEPDQTLADVCAAEATFLREIRSRHPDSPRPLVTGNCQGGWAAMVLAATHPELMGPMVIAGAPLSYWAGEKGKNPFRYLGGLAGGAMPALITSDLGGGRFDGANLVMNFESLNPARTWWRNSYDVFADIDRQAERFLDFERWWSGFYFMNESEIRWILENLFIGNRLSRGEATLGDGTPIDLTRITSPVVVFASHGDNITPPQQALNWIADLYESVTELKARGHVIVYTLHESIGHLGIFVSAKVAGKQHKQITSIVKTIEALAPGLYEMLIERDGEAYQVSFEDRSIDDVLALDDGREEEAEFAAVAQLSEWATRTYELTWRPVVRTMVTPAMAKLAEHGHPMRQQRYFFSRKNPFVSSVGAYAEEIRSTREPAEPENPFILAERLYADLVEQGWNLFRDLRDAWIELTFHSIYGAPWMRALDTRPQNSARASDLRQLPQVKEAVQKAGEGGYPEAIIRMLILLARARGSVRRERLERSNQMIHSRPPFDTMLPEQRSRLIHDQTMIVEFAGKEAITTLPKLLRDEVDRLRAVNLVLDIAGPADEMDAPTIAMFKQLQTALLTIARDWHEPAHEVIAHEPGAHPSSGGEGRTRIRANRSMVKSAGSSGTDLRVKFHSNS